MFGPARKPDIHLPMQGEVRDTATSSISASTPSSTSAGIERPSIPDMRVDANGIRVAGTVKHQEVFKTQEVLKLPSISDIRVAGADAGGAASPQHLSPQHAAPFTPNL